MIKSYLKFTESKNIYIGNYSIYEFFEYLKSLSWSTSDDEVSGNDYIKTWTDHFVGEGYYQKIEKYIDSLLEIFNKIDINYIKDRFSEIFDTYNDRNRKVNFGVIYNSDFDNPNKFNGLIGFLSKNFLIRHIIMAIIYPTLYHKRLVEVRQLHDEIYVTDIKYNCANVSDNLNFKGSELYDVDKIIKNYKPVVKIQVGDDSYCEFRLSDVEKDIENILPSILHSFDYQDVIWDFSKGTRQFSNDILIVEYSIKIVLK